MQYMHGMVILGGHASTEPVNSSFRGNPYLITRLYSLEYKVTCVVHVSRVWISRYIYVLYSQNWECLATAIEYKLRIWTGPFVLGLLHKGRGCWSYFNYDGFGSGGIGRYFNIGEGRSWHDQFYSNFTSHSNMR